MGEDIWKARQTTVPPITLTGFTTEQARSLKEALQKIGAVIQEVTTLHDARIADLQDQINKVRVEAIVKTGALTRALINNGIVTFEEVDAIEKTLRATVAVNVALRHLNREQYEEEA